MTTVDPELPHPLRPLKRFLAGLRRTDLLTDLASDGPHTVFAPVDAAFDALPWAFERLLDDDALLEPRFDLFEYLVLRGTWEPGARHQRRRSLQGETMLLGSGMIIGHQGVARVLRSTTWRGAIVHLVDACIFPSSIVMRERAD